MIALNYVLLTSSTLLITWSSVLSADVYGRHNLEKRSTRFQQLQQLQRGFSGGRGRSPFPGSRQGRLPQLSQLSNRSDWSMFSPEPPTEDEVDCHVEVEVVHHVGGRCVRLFGERRMAVCQSGMYLDVHSDECHNLLRSRELANSQHDAQGETSQTGARHKRSGQTSQDAENNDFRSED